MDTPTKVCSKCGKEYPATVEYFHREKRNKACGLRASCKVCFAKSHRCWKAEHPEKVKEDHRRWREENPEKCCESVRRWSAQHPEKRREYEHRRRAVKRGLPRTCSAEDVQNAFDYWNGYCPVCGEPLRDLFGDRKPQLDHWIAIKDPRPDNPGHASGNVIPLCSKCNSSKNDSDPTEWLNRKFGKRQAAKILARVKTYFAWAKGEN